MNKIICNHCEDVIFPHEIPSVYSEEGTDYYECPNCHEEICIETIITYEFELKK